MPAKRTAVKQEVAVSEHTVTEDEEEDSYMEEPGARTEVIYQPSESDEGSEDVYKGGFRNDFHTQPKLTPSGSEITDSQDLSE